MICNVGEREGMIRAVVGVFLILVGYVYKSWVGLIRLICLATGLLRFCSLYYLLGISTCEPEEQQEEELKEAVESV